MSGATAQGIAVVGLAGRFPGAATIERFWANLRDGVESIRFFTDEELEAAGVGMEFRDRPDYVRAGTVVDDADLFDAGFFGYSPREAEVIDPQQRVFLECCWEALEAAGHNSNAFDGLIGVYAGSSLNTYLLNNLLSNPEVVATVGAYQAMISNDKDFLTTRVSYKLNLKGPSVAVQTACSTGLVAINMACESLVDYRCDLALAGGASLAFPQVGGYLYQPGMILSPDGHCRAFDARAQGTVGGKGVAVVALRRLQDALDDGDPILAVIKGWAINNDGSLKVGFTAPSVEGQAEAIAEAMAMAEFAPETIGYVEAHGTGTELGDPIEVSALSLVYGQGTERTGYCALGSLKANMGHMDAAAGAAGLMKAVLTLDRGEIPPSLNFETPNPAIDFAKSPFFVNASLREWASDGTPRRAAVSSFGIGGTNAHAVLEEAPARAPSGASRRSQLVTLSARSEAALERATDDLAEHFEAHPELYFADAAYTLHVGRRRFEHRRTVVAANAAEAVALLRARDRKRVHTEFGEAQVRSCAFLFTGQGGQYVNMARGLYETEPAFRARVDRSCELLLPHLGLDLRSVLHPPAGEEDSAAESLRQTRLTQPALFVIEHALASSWMDWGVEPDAMLGHSIGEYVAACLAGVFTLEDALAVVAARGRLMQEMAPRAMLAVPLGEDEIAPLLGDGLSLAAVNAPGMCVVSGTFDAVAELEARLAKDGVAGRPLHTSHAFHSAMMDPAVERFTELLARVPMGGPRIPFVSNSTGLWITDAEATDPAYWARHLRQAVRFAEGARLLLEDPHRLLLEVGPGNTLVSLVRIQPAARGRTVLPSLRHPKEEQHDVAFLLTTLGRLWAAGSHVDWRAFHRAEARRRVLLPTYPFERTRYYVEPRRIDRAAAGAQPARSIAKRSDITEWFYLPSWRRAAPAAVREAEEGAGGTWLVFDDGTGLGAALAEGLRDSGRAVVRALPGDGFGRLASDSYRLDPASPEDHEALIDDLFAVERAPRRILHLWGVDAPAGAAVAGPRSFERAQQRSLHSLVSLAKALRVHPLPGAVEVTLFGRGLNAVQEGDTVVPEATPVLGAATVIGQELPGVRCLVVDLPADGNVDDGIVDRLVREVTAARREPVVAFRGRHRWSATFEPAPVPSVAEAESLLRKGGVYVITGGFGGVGMALAERLTGRWQAKVALLGRSAGARRAEALDALRARGARVLALQADVADPESLRRALDAARAELGPIDGVIHAAGVLGDESFAEIDRLDPAAFAQQFGPKVRGTYALAELLSGHQPRFCLLVSSISTVLGGIGYAAYAAANRFLDAFAESRDDPRGMRWLSASWDAWRFDGGDGQGALAELAMTAEEGAETIERVLMRGGPTRMIISTADLEARLDRWVRTATPEAAHEAHVGPAPARHARPEMPSAYVAPADEVEKGVAAIWEDILGIEGIGADDDFLELGGNSLLAVQVASRLQNTFGVSLPIRTLFEAPTAAELAEHVRTARWVADSRKGTGIADATEDREELLF